MSTVAVRIKYLSGSDFTTKDFYDYEILDVDITPRKKSILKRLGTGKPKLVIRPENRTVTITFRLFTTNAGSTSTLSKIKDVESYEANEGKLYIYPKFISDASLYYICIMPKMQILDHAGVAGYNAGGRLMTVQFLEVEAAGEILDMGDFV